MAAIPQRAVGDEHTFLSAAASAQTGKQLNVKNFRHVVVSVATDGGGDAALTAKCQGAIAKTAPDFSAAQAVGNMWDYIGMYDYQSGALVAGDTGFAVATADDYRLFMVNVDGLEWLNFTVTARSEGEVTIKAVGFSNL